MEKVLTYILFAFVLIGLPSSTCLAETAKGSGQQADGVKSFIDIGQQSENPSQSRRLTNEEAEAVKKYVRQVQRDIRGGQTAKSTVEALRSVKAVDGANQGTQTLKTFAGYNEFKEVPAPVNVD